MHESWPVDRRLVGEAGETKMKSATDHSEKDATEDIENSGQYTFDEQHRDFVDLVFQPQGDPARGSVAGESRVDNEAKDDAGGIVLHFLLGDRTVQPGTQFRECFRCDRKELLAAAIGRLVLDRTEKAETQEPLKSGIDGARGIAEMAERVGAKALRGA